MARARHTQRSGMASSLAAPGHPHSQRRKVVGTLAALVATASMARLFTFATFTSATSASSSAASGTVVIALGGSNRLTVNASGLVPTDTIQRGVDLSNTGTQNLVSLTLTVAATSSSLLDTDATNGLQMLIDRCTVAWTEAGNGTTTPYTYTCSGSIQTVVLSAAVVGSNISLSSQVTPAALTAGGTDHLRVTLTLPSTAPNTMQGLTSTLQYTFTGTQRNGSAH